MSLKTNDVALDLLAERTGGDLALLEEAEAGLLTPGQLALLGGLLSELGAELSAQARRDALGILEGREGVDCGVKFESRAGGSQWRVNTARVRAEFPREAAPEFWKEVRTKDTVAIMLPKEERR